MFLIARFSKQTGNKNKNKTKPSLIKEQLCAYMSVMCMCLYCMWLTYWAIAVYFIHICKLCFNVLFPVFKYILLILIIISSISINVFLNVKHLGQCLLF